MPAALNHFIFRCSLHSICCSNGSFDSFSWIFLINSRELRERDVLKNNNNL